MGGDVFLDALSFVAEAWCAFGGGGTDVMAVFLADLAVGTTIALSHGEQSSPVGRGSERIFYKH